jgi:diguanylate cyclase (GGDEF)-like protein
MSQDILQLNPERARTQLSQAKLFADDGKYDKALDLLEEIINKYEPTNLKAYVLAAHIFLDTGKGKEADEVLSFYKLAEKEPKDYSDDEIDFLFCQAQAKFKLKGYTDCLAILSRILEIKHDYLDAVELQADIKVERGQFKEAINMYLSLLNRNHNTTQMYYSLGYAHLLNKEYPHAYHYLNELKKIGETDSEINKVFKKARGHVNEIVIKEDKSMNLLEKWLLRLMPYWAVDRINTYVLAVVSKQKETEVLYTDPMTGCYSKAAISVYLPNFHAKCPHGVNFYISRLDIDYFKSVNDCLGHDMGDRVIKTFGGMLKEHFPDRAFRGGAGADEFIWAFEGTEGQAIQKAKDFRKAIETELRQRVLDELKKSPIRDPLKNNEPITLPWNITCSQGLSEWPEHATLQDAEKTADTNQYQAKLPSVGRNAIFFKLKLVEKGERPIPYTSILVKYLNKLAVDRGATSWWDLKTTLDEKTMKTILEEASKLEDVEKKAALGATS